MRRFTVAYCKEHHHPDYCHIIKLEPKKKRITKRQIKAGMNYDKSQV
jgi:hypothetical protein